MLISILITSVIGIVVFTLFSSLMKQTYMYTETKNKELDYMLFTSALRRDFFFSEGVNSSNRDISMNLEKHKVQYVFDKQFITREVKGTKRKDTFFLKVKKVNKSYIDSINPNLTNNLVERLELQISFLGEDFNPVFKKRYGSDVYINNFFRDEN